MKRSISAEAEILGVLIVMITMKLMFNEWLLSTLHNLTFIKIYEIGTIMTSILSSLLSGESASPAPCSCCSLSLTHSLSQIKKKVYWDSMCLLTYGLLGKCSTCTWEEYVCCWWVECSVYIWWICVVLFRLFPYLSPVWLFYPLFRVGFWSLHLSL